jgi:hypothetical protein
LLDGDNEELKTIYMKLKKKYDKELAEYQGNFQRNKNDNEKKNHQN